MILGPKRKIMDRPDIWNDAVEAAAKKCVEWGDVCCGGCGQEIIREGPSKGQRYGEGYYNLADAVRRLKRG